MTDLEHDDETTPESPAAEAVSAAAGTPAEDTDNDTDQVDVSVSQDDEPPAADTAEGPAAEEPDEPPADEPPPEPRSLPWWKQQAREAQVTVEALTTERGQLAARVEGYQQREAEALLKDTLHDPADLWRYGKPLADMLNDDGEVDPGLVQAACVEVLDAHKHLGRGYGISPAAPASAVTSDGKPLDDPPHSRSFGEVLQSAARQQRSRRT